MWCDECLLGDTISPCRREVRGTARRRRMTPHPEPPTGFPRGPGRAGQPVGVRLGFAINSLEDELAELFHRPVDLVSRRALHRLIRDDVLAEARTLYAA